MGLRTLIQETRTFLGEPVSEGWGWSPLGPVKSLGWGGGLPPKPKSSKAPPLVTLPSSETSGAGAKASSKELAKASSKAPAMPPSKWTSAGGVVLAGSDPEGMSEVWIRKSKSNPGYPSQWTFAKGRVDEGESKTTAAKREVEEEMGLKTSMLAKAYLGAFEGGFSITHYYLMVAKGSPGSHDAETERVEKVTWEKAMANFASSGNNRDVAVAKAAIASIRKNHGVDAIRGVYLDARRSR